MIPGVTEFGLKKLMVEGGRARPKFDQDATSHRMLRTRPGMTAGLG